MNRTISWCALLSALLCAGAALGQLDSDQQKCLNTLNKDVAKLAATQGKENAGCLKRGQTNSGTRFVVAPSCVDR